MALLYQAELRPGKLELVAAWLPTHPWYPGPAAAELRRVAAYRFDDPAGEVGIETLLVQAGDGPLLQTPLTYRNAPLDGREQWLIGTTDHSVLGRRWVYDACGDPVYARALANAILTGAAQAEEFIEVGGRIERRDPSMSVTGGGSQPAEVPAVDTLVSVDDKDPTVILTDRLELTVARVLDTDSRADAARADEHRTLTGTWSGRSRPVLLAHARRL